jgi:DNA-binding CsgD family transcriptional regulator
MQKQTYHIEIEALLSMPGQSGFFWKDCNSYYMGCNDVAAEKSQINSRHEIVEKSDFDLKILNNDEALSLQNGDQLVIRTKRPHCFLYSATNTSDKHIFLTYKAPLWNSNKEIVGIYGMDTYIDMYDEKAYLPILEKSGIPIKDLKKLRANIISHNSLIKKKILTKRQYECLDYLAQGMTTKGIAQQLNLSPRTVEFYFEGIKNKLNCHTRTNLIQFFHSMSKELHYFLKNLH